MIALWRRELRVLLLSPAGIGVLAIWAFLVGAVFLMELAGFEQAEQRALAIDDPALLSLLDVNDLLLASVNNHLTVVLLFLAPMLAMRAWSDGAARDWLLQRAPSTSSFVVARAAGAASMVTAMVLLTLPLPVFLSIVGRPAVGDVGTVVDVGQAVVAMLLVAAAGSTFVAVSAALIVVVDNALAGAVLAFVVLMVLWVAPGGAALTGPVVGEVLTVVSPSTHIEAGLRGLVRLADVLFFVVVHVVATAVTITVLRGRRR
jgi:hypothetical protein